MDNKQKEEILKSMINVEFKPELVERETVNLSLFDTLPLPDSNVYSILVRTGTRNLRFFDRSIV